MLWLAHKGQFTQCSLFLQLQHTHQIKHVFRGEMRWVLKDYISLSQYQLVLMKLKPSLTARAQAGHSDSVKKKKRQHIFNLKYEVSFGTLRAALLSQPLFWSAHWWLVLTECHPNWRYFWNNMHKELVAGPRGHVHTTPRDRKHDSRSMALAQLQLYCSGLI